MHSKDGDATNAAPILDQSIEATPEANRGMIKSISGNINNLEELVSVID